MRAQKVLSVRYAVQNRYSGYAVLKTYCFNSAECPCVL